MNIETSESGPKLNLLKPEGIRNQTSASNVIMVLLDSVGWQPIIPGSFHFYKTAGDKPVPFVQFDVMSEGKRMRIEVFPTAIAGLSYEVDDDE